MKIKDVVRTTYDGFIIVETETKITAYEGIDLCPEKVKEHIKNNGVREIASFYNEAILYRR